MSPSATPFRALWLLVLGSFACAVEAPSPVVLITLDTTRVDHLSCYGYERPTTPHLERLATQSVRHTRAWSTSSWTLPAHASLFSGLFPTAHGARHDEGGGAERMGFTVGVLDPSFDTLAEILQRRGYRTGAFIGGPWLEARYGLLQGFEHVGDEVEGERSPDAARLSDLALGWLEGIAPDEPFFLFVNYFDPHTPYAPPDGAEGFGLFREEIPEQWFWEPMRGNRQPSPRERQILIDRYDSEIRFMDGELGRLIEAIDRRFAGNPPLIVVTADHGEAFGEGGRWLHNYWLAEELTRVPLLVRHPDRRGAGSDRDEPIQLVDVFGLILEALDLPLPEGAGRREGDAVFTELHRSPMGVRLFGPGFDRDLHEVIEPGDRGEQGWKLRRAEPGGDAVLRLDGLAESPMAESEETRARRRELAGRLERHHARLVPAPFRPAPAPDAEEREALRALGYAE